MIQINRKRLLLFVLACFVGGVGTFLGSILGHALSALYAGAIVGGIAGVLAATMIARSRGIVGAKRFWPATIGGILGLILAAIIATHHMDTPIVPLASILLIGLGAVFGAGSRRKPD